MTTLEGMRLKNRERLLSAINKLIHRRKLTEAEANKINYLIDCGRPITEILLILRTSSSALIENPCAIDRKTKVEDHDFSVSKIGAEGFRTPLEKYFQEYVNP